MWEDEEDKTVEKEHYSLVLDLLKSNMKYTILQIN